MSYFLSESLVFGWRNRYVLEYQISAAENGYWVAIFKVSINTNRLLSNIACLISNNAGCTVTFSSGGNISSLIGKQIVCFTALADY